MSGASAGCQLAVAVQTTKTTASINRIGREGFISGTEDFRVMANLHPDGTFERSGWG
jgi:hypothetical protein